MKRFVLIFLLPITLWAQQLQFGPRDESVLQSDQSIDEIALVVNQQAISKRQFERDLLDARAALPDDIPLSDARMQELLRERVIMRYLLLQTAAMLGISPTEEMVNESIARVAAQNNMSVSALLREVRSVMGLSEREYRAQLREQLLLTMVQEAVVGRNVRISQAQINDQLLQIAREQGSTVHLQDILLPVPNLPIEERGQAITEAMARLSLALKENNQDLQQAALALPEARFIDLGDVNIAQIPRRFAAAVLDLRSGEMVANPVVDSDGMHFLKVVERKWQGSQSYMVDEADVAHILIRRNPNNPEAARVAILRIYEALQRGEDFAALALRYSQDSASAVRGGQLGWLAVDAVDPRFAEKMLTAPLGALQAPFESDFGWHIIVVNERRQSDYSEALLREQIRNRLYQAAMQEAWERYLMELRRNAYVQVF